MSILTAFIGGMAEGANNIFAEERAKQKKADERQAELDLFEDKERIKQKYSGKGEYMTKAQYEQFVADNKEGLNAAGYTPFGLPVQGTGDQKDLVKLTIKEIKKDKTAGNLIPEADAPAYIKSRKEEVEKLGLVPEIKSVSKPDGFVEITVQGKSADEKTDRAIYDEGEAEQRRIRAQSEIDNDPLRKGKVIATKSQTKDGSWTVGQMLDPAFNATGKQGPGYDPIGREYGPQYLAANSGLFNSEDELKKSSAIYDVHPTNDILLPRFGAEQRDYVFGRDFDLVFTNGVGSGRQDRLNSLYTRFQTHQTPEKIRQWAEHAEKGGRATGLINSTASAVKNFIELYRDVGTDSKEGVGKYLPPIEKRYPFISELIGIHPKIDEVLSIELLPSTMRKAGAGTTAYIPLNEPVMKKVVDGEEVMLQPENLNTAGAFAKKMPGEDDTKPPVFMYDKEFTTAAARIAYDSNLNQAEYHELINGAIGPDNTPSPQGTRVAHSRIVDARNALEKKKDKFVGVNNKGVAEFQFPTLSERENAKIKLALNSFDDIGDKLRAMRALMATHEILDQAEAFKDGTGPQALYTAIMGGNAASFTSLQEQASNMTEVKTNAAELTRILRDEGGNVGPLLQIERLGNAVDYVFEEIFPKLQMEEGSAYTTEQLQNELREQYKNITGNTAGISESDRRAAMVNLLGTLLSYQLARMMDPNGRLSDEDRRTVQSALGFTGVLATRDSALAVLEAMTTRAQYIEARNNALTGNNKYDALAAGAMDRYYGGESFAEFHAKIFKSQRTAAQGTVPTVSRNPLAPTPSSMDDIMSGQFDSDQPAAPAAQQAPANQNAAPAAAPQPTRPRTDKRL